MNDILTFLQELDRFYASGTLTEYEQMWQAVCQHREHTLPGFTLAYAEIHLAGRERSQNGNMAHGLVPTCSPPKME